MRDTRHDRPIRGGWRRPLGPAPGGPRRHPRGVTDRRRAPWAPVVVAIASAATVCAACGPPSASAGAVEVSTVTVNWHPPGATLPVLVCDWDGNGTDTPATFDRGRWRMCGDIGRAYTEDGVLFGREVDDHPLCGDWDGDGDDEVGVYRRGAFHLRGHDGPRATSRTVAYAGAPATPVVGDWDGDGTDTVGIFRDGVWKLTDSVTGAPQRSPFTYGRRAGDRPVVGDWDGDGIDTVGIVRDRAWMVTDGSNRREVHRFTDAGRGGNRLVASRGGVDVALVARAAPGPVDALRLQYFGDSLAVESRHAFAEEMTGRRRPVEVEVHAFGGMAICDWIEQVRRRTRAAPDVVVMSFTGNNMTPCTEHAEGERLYEIYLRDARTVMAATGRAFVVWTAPPVMRHLGHARNGPIWRAYRQVVAEHPGRSILADGGRLLTPDDVYEGTRPCLASERCLGPTVDGARHNVTRHADGVHLCPGKASEANWDNCDDRYSPGAHRYAATMARPVVDRFLL